MERIIDYGKKLIWSNKNIPTVYKVKLFEEDQVYYLSAEWREGTFIENFTSDEREIFKKVLDLENRQVDFEHVEAKKYYDMNGQVYILKYRINVK
ncbi:MAG: hypothetical protein LLF98_15320 [Clostridium sp.]|uniref:hypothetical protein n=1 Tax=Clostridium sp. TaxID=1506 RepID=UPI0025BC547E|nr:hypothetical protein [Clostridium sp.]MCE5222556.1 hypothetical protein [Clostridium sp.]